MRLFLFGKITEEPKIIIDVFIDKNKFIVVSCASDYENRERVPAGVDIRM